MLDLHITIITVIYLFEHKALMSNPACSLIVCSPALPASQTQGQGAYIASMNVSAFPYLLIESDQIIRRLATLVV